MAAITSMHGLAATAYVREGRRIAAEFTVLETHVGVEARPGADRAEVFPDTVGVGCYRIDLHPSAAGRGYLDIAAYPFQIPLGALLPQRVENLLAAGKCLGVTHVTNGFTGSIPWNGTSARRPVPWPHSASAVGLIPERTQQASRTCRFPTHACLDGCPVALACGDSNHRAVITRDSMG
jgi:hypothetical protein